MTPWLLLALTLACAFLTFDAFRLKAPMKEAPYSQMPSRWKGGFNHLSLAEQNEVQNRSRFYSSLVGMGHHGVVISCYYPASCPFDGGGLPGLNALITARFVGYL